MLYSSQLFPKKKGLGRTVTFIDKNLMRFWKKHPPTLFISILSILTVWDPDRTRTRFSTFPVSISTCCPCVLSLLLSIYLHRQLILLALSYDMNLTF